MSSRKGAQRLRRRTSNFEQSWRNGKETGSWSVRDLPTMPRKHGSFWRRWFAGPRPGRRQSLLASQGGRLNRSLVSLPEMSLTDCSCLVAATDWTLLRPRGGNSPRAMIMGEQSFFICQCHHYCTAALTTQTNEVAKCLQAFMKERKQGTWINRWDAVASRNLIFG
jgi:hypothetical protein